MPFAGLVDTVLLGHEPSSQALSGVALAGAIFSFLYWGFAFLRMGTTGLTSQALGAEDSTETVAVLTRSLGLALGLGALMLLFSPLIELVSFWLLQGEAMVEAQGVVYFQARILGAPAVLGLMAINGWLLGRHLSRQVLLLSIIQNTLIIGLDILFIRYWGWGAAGAGYSTAAADGMTFLCALLVLALSWGRLPRPTWRHAWSGNGVRQLFELNSQIFVRSFFLMLTITSFTNISAWMGETVVAANAILLQLLLFCAYFVDGFAYALESLAGFAAGKGDWKMIKTQLRVALACASLCTLFFALAFWAFGQQLLSRMTDFQQVNSLAWSLGPYFLLALVLANFSYIYDGLGIGLTWGSELRNSVVIASLVGFAPLALLAVHWRSPVTLWLAYAVFSALRSGILGWNSERKLARISMENP